MGALLFPLTPWTPQAARPLQQKAGHASSLPVPPGRTAALQRTAQVTQLTQGSRGALTQPMLPDSLSTSAEHLCRSACSAATVRRPPPQPPVGAAGGQRRPWPEPSRHFPATPCLGPWHGPEPAALDCCVVGATSRQRQPPFAASYREAAVGSLCHVWMVRMGAALTAALCCDRSLF